MLKKIDEVQFLFKPGIKTFFILVFKVNSIVFPGQVIWMYSRLELLISWVGAFVLWSRDGLGRHLQKFFSH